MCYRWCIAEMARITRMWSGVAGQSQGPLQNDHMSAPKPTNPHTGHTKKPRANKSALSIKNCIVNSKKEEHCHAINDLRFIPVIRLLSF